MSMIELKQENICLLSLTVRVKRCNGENGEEEEFQRVPIDDDGLIPLKALQVTFPGHPHVEM